MSNPENNVCPKCGGEIWMVEYPLTDPFHYDGTSEYACANALKGEASTCDYRIGRFCGQRLQPHEVERPRCTGTPHVLVG